MTQQHIETFRAIRRVMADHGIDMDTRFKLIDLVQDIAVDRYNAGFDKAQDIWGSKC